MRLLLDEMHAASTAASLRDLGFDVVAVTETPALRGTRDDELLQWATGEVRAIVTENVRDFVPIAHAWAAAGQPRSGLIFTNPRRFNRAMINYPGTLVVALRDWLETSPTEEPSGIWWL